MRCRAIQLNLRLAALTSAMLMSISFLMSASNSADVMGIGSIPCGLNLSSTPGVRNAFSVSRYSRSTMAGGVLAGTNSQRH
jgi:hypothetical protein